MVMENNSTVSLRGETVVRNSAEVLDDQEKGCSMHTTYEIARARARAHNMKYHLMWWQKNSHLSATSLCNRQSSFPIQLSEEATV